MHDLANLYGAQNQYDEAEELYKQTLVGKIENLGTKHQSALRIIKGLAVLYRKQGRYDEPQELYQSS